MLRFDERVHLPKNRENTITFLVNGEPIGTVETLAPGAKTVDIPIPPVDYDSVTDALGYVPYDSTNPNGYITGITSSDVTTALGYTPQEILVSGSNIKTINNTSLLGSGNIDIQGGGSSYTAGNGINIANDVISIDNTVALKSDIPIIPEEVFIAEYGTTTYQDVLDAYNSGKAIYAKRQVTSNTYEVFSLCGKQLTMFWFANPGGINQQGMYISPQTTVYTLDAQDTWDIGTFTNASNTLSNVTAIDASSAVQTALDDKVSKAGDTMTGALTVETAGTVGNEMCRYMLKNTEMENNVTPSINLVSSFSFVDKNNTQVGSCYYRRRTDNVCDIRLMAKSFDGTDQATLAVGFNSSGDAYCSFPNTERVDGQWTYKNTSLGSNVKWDTSSHKNAKDYSLANYLPQDNYNYEVILRASVATGATSGNYVSVGVSSDILTAQHYVCQAQTRASASVGGRGEVIVIVGPARKITVAGASSGANGTYTMAVTGYKRMGTNG